MKKRVIDIKAIQKIETKMAENVIEILEKHNIYNSMAYGSVLGAVRHKGPIPWDLDMDMYICVDDLWDVIKILRSELPDPFTVDYYDINPNYRLIYPRVSLKNSSSDLVHIDLFLLFGLPQKNEIERIKFFDKVKKTNKIYYHYKNETFYIRRKSTKLKHLIAFCLAKSIEIFYLPITKKYLRKRLEKLLTRYPLHKSQFIAGDPCIEYDKEKLPRELLMTTGLYEYDGLTVKIPKEYDEYLKHLYGEYMTFPDEHHRNVFMKLTAVISENDYNLLFENN